jgi:hypothetical protein
MSRKTSGTIATLATMLIVATPAPGASLADNDLRSQDALDAARSLPPEQLVAVSERLRSTTARAGVSDGFHWPSALIGAASLLGLVGVSRR